MPNYYATGPVEDTWFSDGVLHRFHRRTMGDLLEAMGAGFLLERYLEALPPDAVLAAFPDADVPPDPFFLFFRAVPAHDRRDVDAVSAAHLPSLSREAHVHPGESHRSVGARFVRGRRWF